MDILSATRALGEAIQQDDRFVAYAKAKLANDNDEKLQAGISEFNLVRMQLDQEMSAEKQDDDKVRDLNEKLRSIYGEVMASEAMVTYNTAKAALDAMLNDINSVIMQCVEGAEPATCEPETHSCSGSCATCGGCH